MRTKKIIIILFVVFILSLVLYKLNHGISIVEQRDGIKIVYYYVNFPFHVGGYHSLFYENKRICKVINSVTPNRFLLSLNSGLILYLNAEDYKANSIIKYEIYDTKTRKKILFPNARVSLLVGLNDKVEWFEDKVILSNSEQRDILNLKDGTMKIEKTEKK